MGTQLPAKGAQPPIFGPCLLWPNGRMDQDATWFGGRPQPWPHYVRWGPSPPTGHSPSFLARVFSGQTTGWIKMPLGTEVGLVPGSVPRPRRHCVRWKPSAPTPQKRHSPQFSTHVYCGQTAVCIRIPLGTDVGLSLGDIMLDGDPAPSPIKWHSPLLNFRPMSIVAMVANLSYC